jgi:hypothetical protein
MSYTRKQHGKKSKMTRNIRNRNYKKNNKKNKKYGGVVPAVTFSTATKAGLFGKKAISAVKVGSKISKGNISGVGVGLLDDALLHSGSYFFGKKGKKQNKKNKKQRGGDGGAIDALITTLDSVDNLPVINILKTMPAYKIFAGIKDKLINLLNIVQNQDIQTVLNNPKMSTEEIKKQIKNIISKNDNIKAEIDKYKEVCSKLDSILDEIKKIEIMGNKIGEGFVKNIEAQLEKAIPHRKELFSAFTEFDVNEKLEIENPDNSTDDVLENNTNIDESNKNTNEIIDESDNIEKPESKDNVIEENTIEIENPDNSTGDVLENNTNIDESNKNTNEIIDESDNIEKPEENTTGENSEKTTEHKNCDKATGISRLLLGEKAVVCYPNSQQEGAGSRKNKKSKKSKKSNKKPRKGSRKTKKSYKRLHRKK